MRRHIAALTAFVAMLVPAAATAQAPPKIADVPAGIARLLDDRTKAWTNRDRDLLSRTVQSGPFAARQLQSFDNASALQFDQDTFRADTHFSADIAGPRVKALHPGLEVSAYGVRESSRIGGYDLIGYAEDSFFTFVREKSDAADPYDGWRLASTSDFEVLGAYSAVHLWDAGPVGAATSEHFMILSHPKDAARAARLLPLAEDAYASDKAWWPRAPGARYVILAPGSTEELGDLIQATVDLEKFVAFAAATINTENGFEPAGVRIYLHMSHLQRYDSAGAKAVIAHELLHAITRPLTGPAVPSWIEEGMAMFGSEPERKDIARRSDHDRFPTDDEFYVGSTNDIVTRYYQGQTAVSTLVARSGVEGLAKFYESLGSTRVAPGTDAYHVARATREALNWSVDDWTASWRRHLG